MAIEGGPSACIDENLALDFVQGRLAPALVHQVDEHADGCLACRVLLDEAVRSFRDRSTYDVPGEGAPLTVFTRGDVLANRYRIDRFIARGGMGEVYQAEDLLLGGRLAVKTMNAAISDDANAIRRLKQEVNLARRITHENVCRIFDIGIHEPTNPRPGERVLFLTMELIDGISLGDRLRTGGPLSEAEARPIVAAMAAALVAAHRAGVVHRDFKSDNVMLARGGEAGNSGAMRVVVMDFGLARDTSARAAGSGSQEGVLTGTLAYMAPEQIEGRATNSATDIYALGIVMFEMLTGYLPFEGEAPLGGALRRLIEPAPSLRTSLPGIDPAWETVVGKCLEREAGRRPASVEEVVRAIAAEVSAAPVAISAPAPRPRKTKWRSQTVGATGLVLATVTFFVGLYLRSHHAPSPMRSSEDVEPSVKGSFPLEEIGNRNSANSQTATLSTEIDPGPVGPKAPQESGSAQGVRTGRRGASARPLNHHRQPRHEPDPDGPAATPVPPLESSETPPAPRRPRSEDLEDGFILRRP